MTRQQGQAERELRQAAVSSAVYRRGRNAGQHTQAEGASGLALNDGKGGFHAVPFV